MSSTWDCEELAAHLVGIDYDECEDEDEIWARLYDKYDIDDDEFIQLISDLLPMIQVGETVLGKRVVKGFGKVEGGLIKMFVKMDA